MAKQTFTTGQVLTAAQMTSLQQTAMGGGSTTAKTASYTLVAADAGTVVQMNSATATTITVNTALFSAGDTVQIQNVGTGVCTVTAGTATVSTAGSLALSQYEGGQLYFNTTSAALFFDIVQTSGMTNPLTTTGDTIYSSSGTTPARLGIGSTGNVLTVSGGLPVWSAPAGGGKVLQVVYATYATSTSTSATSFSDTGLTATITPTLNTSTIMIFVNHASNFTDNQSSSQQMNLRILRDSTNLYDVNFMYHSPYQFNSNAGMTIIRKDSPATTSAVVYKTQFKAGYAYPVTVQSDSVPSSITLFEIGA